jgi:hypothetical protein
MIPNVPALGILFDIDKVPSDNYGLECWKVFWSTVDAEVLRDAVLYEGDTLAPAVYCIAIQTTSDNVLRQIRATLDQDLGFQKIAASPRFAERGTVVMEPLVETARVDKGGNLLVDATAIGGFWPRVALDAVRKEREDTAHLKSQDESRSIDLLLTRIDPDPGGWRVPLSAEEKQYMRHMCDDVYGADGPFFAGLTRGWEGANYAWRLEARYGKLVEVQCLRKVPPWIELLYEDGHKLVVTDRSGYQDISLINFGYAGTGPSCFCAFLKASGFNVTLDEIKAMRAPCVLRRNS